MDDTESLRKTGLRYGDVAAVARALGLTRHHVNMVAKRERQGSPELEERLAALRLQRAQELKHRRTARRGQTAA